MKNIHILPTSKPSRLHTYKGVLNLAAGEFVAPIIVKNDLINQHIYITNSEEIKEGDWIFSTKTNNLFKANSIEYLKSHNMIEDFDKSFYINSKYAKKVILTTDQSLDGVQPISNEFLEWFVKNPSCEEVEVVDNLKYFNLDELRERHLKGLPHLYSEKIDYKIIIPKPKQETLNLDKLELKLDDALAKETKESISNWLNSKRNKQETLEEAAENYWAKQPYNEDAFMEGAKWQHQQSVDFSNINANNITTASTQNQTLWKEMYSEEDMRQSIFTAFLLGVDRGKYSKELEDKLIEQFKKK